jgi:iron complex outermembrane receptor protein
MRPQYSCVTAAVIAALSTFGAARPAVAQPSGATDQRLDRVEVTGSSIKRIAGETALPVQVITAEDIARSGVTSSEQLLRTISAVDAAGITVSANNAGLSTGGLSTVSLRGLGSRRTLVLINGKRIAPYGSVGDSTSVDVNLIPISAIQRVEVLKEGASAVYGSDAIAGVVNFILRSEFTGADVSAEYGQSASGGGAVTTVTGAYGFGSLEKNRFNVNFLATYQKSDAIYGADRDYAKRGFNVSPDSASDVNNDTTSGNTFPANIATQAGRTIGNPLAGNCGPVSVTDPFFPPTVCRYDPSPAVTLLPGAENWTVMGSARYAVKDNLEAYAQLSYTHRDIFTQIQPVPLSDQFALPPTNPLFNVAPYNGSSTFLLRPTSPYYPAGYIAANGFDPTQPVLVRYRAWESGPRQTRDVAETPRIVLGLTGSAAGWDYNASYLYTSSKLTESVEGGFPILTRILPLLNTGQVNPFGPSTPDVQAQIRAANFNGDTYVNTVTLQSLQASASKELMRLASGGPLALAFGAELRREGYDAQPSQLLLQGDLAGYGGNQAVVDVTRNVYSAYGELSAAVLKELELGAALRFDNYQNTGSKTTGRLSARYQPSAGVLLRGSAGLGFRAPSLSDLYSAQTTSVSTNGVSDPLRCPTTRSSLDCATQFTTTIGGNPDLKPETSVNYNLGILLEPTTNISTGADFWRIHIKDGILVGGVGVPTILADLTRWGSLVTRGPVQPAFPTLPGPIVNIEQTNINQGRIDVAGIDVNFNWRGPRTSHGGFAFGFNGTYISKYDIELPDGSVVGAAGTWDANIPGPVARWKHYAAVTWQSGPWTATLAQRYQNSYRDVPGNASDFANGVTNDPPTPHKVDAYQTWDLQGTWSATKALLLTVGVRNVFDQKPPYSNVGAAGSQFQAGYDISYVDVHDRFVYGRVAYRFQ